MGNTATNHVTGTIACHKGAQAKGMNFEPIVEQCQGCDRVIVCDDGSFCNNFAAPAAKWRRGPCNMATHVKVVTKVQEKVRVGQQKQKKK